MFPGTDMQEKISDYIQIKLSKIVSIQDDTYIVLSDDSVDKKIYTNQTEGAILSFHFTRYGDFSYVKTIYQIFDSFLKSSGYTFDECLIADYTDAIGYCQIKISKNKKAIYFPVSVIDGLIIAILEKIPLYCSTKVWHELDDFSDEETDYTEFG
jgi:bifunctional DNase/RNase